MRHEAELTGLKLGTWTLVERSLHGRGSDGSFLWRCVCDRCGRERHVSVCYVRTLQRRRKAPTCAACERLRCRKCGDVGHLTAECRRRVPGRICGVCCSLPHRVVGKRCQRCRLRYEPEQLPRVEHYARGVSAFAAMMQGGGES